MRVALRVDHKFDALAVVLEQVLPSGDVQEIQTVRNFPRAPYSRRRAIEFGRLQAGAYGVDLHIPEEDS